MENIFIATKTIFNTIIQKAGREEKEKNSETGNKENELIVSGDGSWSKRGFSSLFGVITLIGHYSNKVLDLAVKSSFCKACISWRSKRDTPEYDKWLNTHHDNCLANHAGSAGKM
ncbi:hypothetical protein X777_05326 [Ooceraea biroi]|uniref:Mutator-like transposase domain-containing protein n=1 Tax=Ooceraea biroi TaxID=2015173 RepID=A0A026WJ79_OOCBI|nr:hypothetical protein X777_05326 [Ooceraea biroi]